MPVNTKQIKDAWMGRTNEYMVINNTAVTTVRCNSFSISKQPTEYFTTFSENYPASHYMTHKTYISLKLVSWSIFWFTQVKIIGQMRGMRKDEYKGTFKIEDCCGVLKASIWFTGERDELDCVL